MNKNLYKSGMALTQEMEQTRLPEGTAALWALGQEGFLIQVGDKRVLVDPYITDSIYASAGDPWVRRFAPPISPELLPALDAVLCTHHHGDHMDGASLRPLQGREHTKFVIPRAHAAILAGWGFTKEQLIGLNHEETVMVHGIEIRALAAKHDEFRQDEGGNHYFLGYILKYGGLTIYHAGDTVGFPELVEWVRAEKPDIALIPMNGRDYARTAQGIIGNCNYREAADLAVAVGADIVIPMHYGLFAHNDENPAYFVDYLYRTYPGQKFHMAAPGERFVYMK
jgi:L-ascorbate 6-phosphate lactonase